MRLKVLSSLLALGMATAAVAQAPAPPAFTFALHGFVSGTVGVQDAPMNGEAGLSLFAQQYPGNAKVDRVFWVGDVRQTRLNFSVKGPTVLGGATPTGVVEIDFFGMQGPGAFGDESVIPRIRLGYVETNWGNDVLRVGQFHDLIITQIPASAAHIAFPFAYAAGLVGWRSPGVTYYHKMKLEQTNLELAAQIARNSWATDNPCAVAAPVPGTCYAGSVNANSLGEAWGLPQIELKVTVSGGTNASPWPLYPVGNWLAYLGFHYDQKDLSGAGAVAPPTAKDKLTTYILQGGFKTDMIQNLTIAANGWWGQNAGAKLGHIVQFDYGTVAPPVPPSTTGFADLKGYGAWGQVGWSPIPHWSAWGFMGFDLVSDWAKSVQTGGPLGNNSRLRNVNSAIMIAYRDGPWVGAFEWLHSFTTYATVAAGALTGTYTANGNQGLFTVDYFF
ncbi:MAG TPA: hypothetical protein VFF02_09230 [Anaeromyxobacteraceae bacterium]|nr:hypothetical protein [Anaeromyxobacteraceae bacterium]